MTIIISNNIDMATKGRLIVVRRKHYKDCIVCVDRKYNLYEPEIARKFWLEFEDLEKKTPTPKFTPSLVDLTPVQIGQTWSNYNIYDPSQKAAIETIKANADKWLVFYGSAGTGKGHVASAVMKDKLYLGYTAVYTSAFTMLNECAGDVLREKGAIYKYLACDLLIVDEFEKAGAMSEGKMASLFEILNHKIDYKQQVIIITNYDWTTLPKLVGDKNAEAILDRMAQQGIIVHFNWESYRQIKAAQELSEDDTPAF
jgi:hypothetical protein